MNPSLIEAINAGLKAFPGMRTGQLLVNCLPVNGVPHAPDLFYISDEHLIAYIWRFIAKKGKIEG